MSNSTNETLQSAFDLIEQGHVEQAQELLEPLLESEANNPAVWWVYAHAVQDPDEGVKALDKVIQLDPTYPGANELKSKTVSPSVTEVEEEIAEPIGEWDELQFQQPAELEQSSERSPVRNLLIAIVVILVTVGIFALLSGAFGDSNQAPTEVADQPNTALPTDDIQIVTSVSATENASQVSTEIPETDSPTDEPATDVPTTEPTEEIATDAPTEEPATETPTTEPTSADSYLSSLVENLSEFEISEADIKTRETPLGSTLDVTVCALPGAESSLALNGVMDILVEQNTSIPEDVSAIAVSVLDCDAEQPFTRTIGVERSFVQSFIDEEIEVKDFQRQWQPLP